MKRAEKLARFPTTDRVKSLKALSSTRADPTTIVNGVLKQSNTTQQLVRKKTVLENSNRILLGHRPGKKKKKRGFKQDVAIWNSPENTP